MKKYDMVAAAAAILWLVICAGIFYSGTRIGSEEDMRYKIEINRIMTDLVNAEDGTPPEQGEADRAAQYDLRGMQYVRAISFLPAGGSVTELGQPAGGGAATARIRDFFRNHNGVNSAVYPVIRDGNVTGYLRFDYVTGTGDRLVLRLAVSGMVILGLAVLGVLWYVRMKIIKPFHVISGMPYELAKGNLAVEPQESRERFFGKFVWGIGMLRDALYDSRNRALELEKEKKLMLLSLSHDIKIPLSAIKLYARALREGICGTAEKRGEAAGQIEKHAGEIETFIKKIMSTASEEIIDIEVADTEFYLGDYVNKIRAYYEPKCSLVMTRLHVGAYENKLLKGDMDRAFEVVENLMENAFKYGDGRQICLEFREEDYCQVIELYNTGVPVSAQELPHLFDSFYRGSNAQDKAGNGLGLYIGRQIMLKMEGELYARREQDGMRFGLVFRT